MAPCRVSRRDLGHFHGAGIDAVSGMLATALRYADNGSSPIDRVLAHLEGMHRSGTGWRGKCPHHRGDSPSLSVSERDDGSVGVHCFRGCDTHSVLLSAGLAWVDLFPAGSRERFKARTWHGLPMNPNGRPALASFGDDQVAALLGELARLAKVRNTLDKPVATALRALAAAVGVSPERLTEAVRAALATEESA
jgi:hypothetical protein